MSGGLRIPLSDVVMSPEDIRAVTETLESGWLTMGPRTAAVEAAYAELIGVRHAVAVSSGTAALHLAYLGIGIGPGDEVIVPSVTFVATAAAVHHCGAVPVLADVVGAGDLGLDPDDVRAKLTDRTRAVCAMHYAGYPAQMEALREVCADAGVELLEDSAHHPALRPTSRVACLSFFTNKVLACGEGGMVLTDDDELAARIRLLRAHGLTRDTWSRHRAVTADYDVRLFGFNYRPDDMRMALLGSRLGRIDDEIANRRRLVRAYRARLGDLDRVTVPYLDDEVDASACYVMPVVLDAAIDRAAVRTHLESDGIQTSILYPSLSTLDVWQHQPAASVPRAEDIGARQLTLPLYGHMAVTAVDEVCDALIAACIAQR